MTKAGRFISLCEDSDTFLRGDEYSEVKVGNKDIYVASEDAFKKAQLRPEKDYVKLKGDLAMMISNINRGDVYKAVLDPIGGEYDTAYPQDWANENREELLKRGGAVWLYPKGHKNKFREDVGPVFWDTIMDEFKKMVLQKYKNK
jgi:hypothetical protein